jgi:hypothetical protein
MESTDNLANGHVSNGLHPVEESPRTLTNPEAGLWEQAKAAYDRERKEKAQAEAVNCHLYFVQVAKKRGPVKIGRGKDPAYRLTYLQIACPYELRLLGTLQGCGHWERRFHIHLASDRLRGEWFKWVPRVEALVQLALAGGDWQSELQPTYDRLDESWFIDSPLYAPVSPTLKG